MRPRHDGLPIGECGCPEMRRGCSCRTRWAATHDWCPGRDGVYRHRLMIEAIRERGGPRCPEEHAIIAAHPVYGGEGGPNGYRRTFRR